MVNSHGDTLLWTIDHFTVARSDRRAIEQALACLDAAAQPEGKETRFNVTSADLERVVLGSVTVSDGKLRLESNSARRADELRARIEGLSEGKLRQVGRTHSDPLSAGHEAGPRGASVLAAEELPQRSAPRSGFMTVAS